MSDINDIVEGCRKKNKRAQQALFERYAPVLLGICMRYVKDKSEAEDILQEGFLKIFLNINEFAGKGSFENWMKKIIVNTAITFYHRNYKHHQNIDIDDVSEGEVITLENPEGEYNTNELLNLINSMPQGYKVIFNLYAIEGYKHKEIAEMLKIDENTSKSQYARARKWMQNKLEQLNIKIEV
ncbi:RNA polymerase sigma factor [Bacteroidota bacterium]